MTTGVASHLEPAPPGPSGGVDSGAFLRSIIDALSAHIAILDHSGVVLAVNTAWRRFAIQNGYRGTSFGVGERYLAVCDDAASQGVDDACAVGNGIREVIADRVFDFRHDYRCDLVSGPRFYQVRVTRFSVSGERFIVVAHEDITEVRLADEAARASEQKLRAVLTGAPMILFALDHNGVFTVSSGDGLKLLGLTEGEVVGRTVWEIYASDPATIEVARRALAGERFTSMLELDGRFWETRWVPKLDESGKPAGTIGVAIDATDRVRAEQELQRHREHLEALVAERTRELQRGNEQLAQADRLASLGTLAAGLGHDLANLLLPMRCRLDALEAASLPPPLAGELRALRQAIELLHRLAGGLQMLSQDPKNPSAVSGAVTDFDCWWNDIGQIIARTVPSGIELAVEIPEGLPSASVAPHLLAQAVLNLIVNAVEACSGRKDAKITLRVSAEPREPFVTLSVTDNGAGMPDDVRRHAFEPFFTTKRRGRSTGLGLSIVHSVIAGAGGMIGIDSVPGRGTTISLTLPIAGRSAPVRRPSAKAPTVAVSLADARRAALMVQLLRVMGYAPRMASDGEPGEAEFWLTEPISERAGPARAFLAGAQGRRVIVDGVPCAEWAGIDAILIDETRGVEGLRRAFSVAAGSQTGSAS